MEERNFCYKYHRPAVTTDCVIFGFDGTKPRVLLIERANEPYKGCWAFPGGFVNMDESCEQGALRELQEETGLTSTRLSPMFSPDPIQPYCPAIPPSYTLLNHAPFQGRR
ncbi:MAG: NUDIX hydrolase [Bacteroidaceae bacterium]|nr:NUDIX hydrolase [Bacteroidaceae bacterium]